MTIQSMTGFASLPGSMPGFDWVWEVRSVNARGLDVRMRLPEGLEAIEQAIRSEAGKHLRRGSINLVLKLNSTKPRSALRVDADVLSPMLEAFQQILVLADAQGMQTRAPDVADIYAKLAASETGSNDAPDDALKAALLAELPLVFTEFASARKGEGSAIKAILSAQIDLVENLLKAALGTAEARAARTSQTLRSRVNLLLGATSVVDEARLAQELAFLAVKADVTEELDRLNAHLEAARILLANGGAIGRKLDFLMQEFNREANTLCSKSGDVDLTAIGLELKVVIDQMREQVQNVE